MNIPLLRPFISGQNRMQYKRDLQPNLQFAMIGFAESARIVCLCNTARHNSTRYTCTANLPTRARDTGLLLWRAVLERQTIPAGPAGPIIANWSHYGDEGENKGLKRGRGGTIALKGGRFAASLVLLRFVFQFGRYHRSSFPFAVTIMAW